MNKNIFCFRLPDGSNRFADPLVLERRFTQALGGDPDSFLARAQLPEGQEAPGLRMSRYDAEERLAAACLHAFELPAFDKSTGEGFLEQDALRLLWAWLAWAEKKSNSGASPASGQPGIPDSPPSSSPPPA